MGERGLLLIFQSERQASWLVASRTHLHLVVDRLTEPAPAVRWRIPSPSPTQIRV